MPNIALFQHHPEASIDCCKAVINALPGHNIRIFSEDDINEDLFKELDMIVFPGGIGDSDIFPNFFTRRKSNLIADFIDQGGKYLGICMGAYWASSRYFDLINNVEAVQYIKRPNADVKRSYGTTAPVHWRDQKEDMYFYDGCALIGDETKFETIARYANGDPMAITQGNVTLIGCHPEALEYWFNEPWAYLKPKWNEGRHHCLLNDLVIQILS
jgi:glutamine amidotransferase-like uncharacterized protein